MRLKHVNINIWIKCDYKIGVDVCGKYKSIGIDIFPTVNVYFYEDKDQSCLYVTIGFLFWGIHLDYER